MQLTHSENTKYQKEVTWQSITQINNWIGSLGNTKISKQINENTYEIITKVNLGIFHLELIGEVSYKTLIENEKLHISIHQKSKSLEIQASIDVEVKALSEITSEIKIYADIDLTGPISGMASKIAEKIFINLFETICKKVGT